MCQPTLSLLVSPERVVDMDSVPNCCKAVKYSSHSFHKYCSNCGNVQPTNIQPTLMHGFQAKEDLRVSCGRYCLSTVLCNDRMVEMPPSVTFNKKWPVVRTGAGFVIDVARGSPDIKRALSSTEFLEAAKNFNIPCTQDDLVIQCRSESSSTNSVHLQLC